MQNIWWVGLGGFIGAVARYKLGGLILHRSTELNFPLSTFAVNVIGCLMAGLLSGLVQRHDVFSAETRLFLFAGCLGGFTTFSAFGLETVSLLQRQELGTAILYVFLSISVGIAALWAGNKILF